MPLNLLLILPSILCLLACGACSSAPRNQVMEEGPAAVIMVQGLPPVAVTPSTNLKWIVAAAAHAGPGTDGRGNDLTLAVADMDDAGWLLQTRISGKQALELSMAMEIGLREWEAVPCLKPSSFPMEMKINRLPGGEVEGSRYLVPKDVEWRITHFHGGNLSRPLVELGVDVDGGSGHWCAMPFATVTMDLSTARRLQSQLKGVAGSVRSIDALESHGSTGGPGWEVLFSGHSLDHFRGFKKDSVPAGWTIEEGNLTRTGPGGDIITREQYDDFELELEWKVQPNGNSGIFYNVAEEGYDQVWQTGPEMQILDDERHYDGKNRLTCAGSNYALHAAPEGVVHPAGQWNKARIVVCGDDVEHWLNGVRVVSYRLHSTSWNELVAGSKFKDMPDYGTRDSGHIALQDHGDVVSYRNIRIRRLN